MGYEDATATKIMATHCCACGKPLVDAKSVETGMGPICRSKYGYDLEVPERVRELANKIVHRLACDVSHGTVSLESMLAASQLRDLGFPKIADIFHLRLVPISITVGEHEGQTCYFVRAPYHDGYRYDSWTKTRAKVKRPAVSTSKKQHFFWVHPKDEYNRKRIWKALVKHFSGYMAIGPDGLPFQVQPLKTAAEKAAEAAAAAQEAA